MKFFISINVLNTAIHADLATSQHFLVHGADDSFMSQLLNY